MLLALSTGVSMGLHGGSWWRKPWLWFGSGRGWSNWSVLGCWWPRLAQLHWQAAAWVKSIPTRTTACPGWPRLLPQLLPSSGCFSNKLWFGAADSSASVDLSRLLQGHFGENPTKVWISVPPPAASNTQSWLGLWQVYAFPKGNGGRRRRIAGGRISRHLDV